MVRLLMISLSAVSLLFLAVFSLRQIGLYQIHPMARHPLLDRGQLSIFDPPPSALTSVNDYLNWCNRQAQTVTSGVFIPVIPLVQTKDSRWLVSLQIKVPQTLQGQSIEVPINVLNFDQIMKNPNGSVLAFEDLAPRLPDGALAFEIFEKQPSQATQWTKFLSSRTEQNILILSPNKFTAKQHRKLHPQWLFATDPSTVSQAMVFQGLFLETMLNIWADLWLSPAKMSGRTVFTPRLLAELSRRKIKVLLDQRVEVFKAADWPEGLSDLVQGFRLRTEDL